MSSLTSTLVLFPRRHWENFPDGEGARAVLAEFEVEEDVIGYDDEIVNLMIFNTHDEKTLDYIAEKIPSFACIVEDRDNCTVALYVQKDCRKVLRTEYRIPDNKRGESDYETGMLDRYAAKALKMAKKTFQSW